MKKRCLKLFVSSLITLMVVFLNLAIQEASAEDLKKIIIGNWHHFGTTETVEFFEDGTVIFSQPDEELIGDYKFIDQNRIRIDFAGMGAFAGPQVTRISVDKGKLILENFLDDKCELIKMTEARQLYLEGRKAHIKKDIKKAAEFYKKSAELGEVEAQLRIARMYINGDGVEKDDKQGLRWANVCAEKNFLACESLLGYYYYYYKGDGTKKDIKKAIFWYQKAAENNDDIYQRKHYAQNALAWIYATSENPKYRDGEMALKYAQMAYSQQPKIWYINSTLAAAYARAGQFEMAVTKNKKAIDLLKRDHDLSPEKKQKYLDEAEIRLGLYQNGQAYDESFD